MDQHPAAAENKALIDEVLRRPGRNGLLFQQIAGLLKFLVVHHRAAMQLMGDERNQLVHHFWPRWRPDSPMRIADASA